MATTCTLMRQSLGLITTEMVASVVAGVEVSVEEEGEVTGAEVAGDVTEDVDVDLVEGVEGVTEAVEVGALHTSRALVQLVQERRQHSVMTSEALACDYSEMRTPFVLYPETSVICFSYFVL